MDVDPDNFRAQLRVLRAHADIVPLWEVRERGARPRVAVTFDDGYLDNLDTAVPLLEAAGAPATIFVATRNTSIDGEFWWDRLRHLLLDGPGERPHLDLALGSGRLRIDVRQESGRRRAIATLTRRIRYRRPEVIDSVMEQVTAQVGRAPKGCASHRRMTTAEVAGLAARGDVDVGAHTRHHWCLTSLDRAEAWDEIDGSARDLEALLGRRPRTFAYPFGVATTVDRRHVRQARAAGYRLACLNSPGRVGRTTNPHSLPRVLVGNWPSEEFEGRLLKWLAV
jgi:peptidoglycan/xylan/chitin deacetylase (PgdA/CDA1 family)